MSSILHNQLKPFGSRARRAFATAVVGLALASAGWVVASTVPQAPSAEGGTAPVPARVYHREMRAYEAKGYAPTACTTGGTVLVNPHTNRSVTIEL